MRVAEMMTSHLRGTKYDIFWCSHTGFHQDFPNVDTGIECQPCDPEERELDFRNDFIHARRAIAAAAITARMYLDEMMAIKESIVCSDKDILINLRTNCFDRGKISISPQNRGKANLLMEIGSGSIRYPNARPSRIVKVAKTGIHINEEASPLSNALEVLAAEGPWMLNQLAEFT